jgi:hypothetical protein
MGCPDRCSMNKCVANALDLISFAAVCISGWAAYQVGAAIKENRAALSAIVATTKTGTDDVFSESRDVTIALLRPCKAGKPETCGLVPSVNQVARDTGAATLAMQTQIEQAQPLIQNATAAVSELAAHGDKALDATSETAQAASKTLNSMGFHCASGAASARGRDVDGEPCRCRLGIARSPGGRAVGRKRRIGEQRKWRNGGRPRGCRQGHG